MDNSQITLTEFLTPVTRITRMELLAELVPVDSLKTTSAMAINRIPMAQSIQSLLLIMTSGAQNFKRLRLGTVLRAILY